jgi:hypothetical protein
VKIEEEGKCDTSPNPECKAEVLLHSLETLLTEYAAQSVSERSPTESETEPFFVPDYLKLNAYRVLRLPAKSNYSEIHNASASMKRAAKLGIVRTIEADISLLGEISRTEADIQTAIGRISDPLQRLRDRLFWFYLTPRLLDTHSTSRLIATFRENPEATAALNHDKALHVLLCALRNGLDDVGIQFWIRALRAWHEVVSDDSYWSLTQGLEERGSFEPPAFPSEINDLRDSAVRLAAEGLVVAARAALSRNELSTVRRILSALQELSGTGLWTDRAQDDIISPTLEQFQKSCDAVRNECNTKIVREQNGSACNKTVCSDALGRFRAEIEPALKRLGQLIPPEHHLIRQSKEEAARCLHSIALNLTWADDFARSVKLHEEALNLAQGTATALEIEGGLFKVRESAKKQRLFGDLKPISSAPPLFTLNGFGCTVYGNSDFDVETRSCVMTYYFVALFIPVFPIARYRVIQEGGGQYRFLGKVPLRNMDRWHLGLALAAIIGAFIVGNIGTGTSSSSSFASSSSNRVSSPTPTWSSNHTTATVPYNSVNSQLSNLKAQIDAGRSRHAALVKQLQPIMDELENLKGHNN